MNRNNPRPGAILGGALLLLAQYTLPVARLWPGDQAAVFAANPGPTPAQIHALVLRLVENQHRNDQALEEFERVEHVVSRKSGDNSAVLGDRTDLAVPSGAGTMRLRMAQDGTPVSPEAYRRQLGSAVDTLQLASNPNDRWKQDYARYQKRQHERTELVDAAARAFRVTWAGRETTRNGQTVTKLLLDPDPDYKPTLRFGSVFEHVHATLWVDEPQSQLVRLEGDISSDINFGGGIIAKVYHGGHFVIEQAEVAPGVWLPTLYTYDVDGRKLLFSFGIHERTEVSRYRRIGPPAQSVRLIREELNSLADGTPAW